MFFKKKQKEDDDAQFSQLDELVKSPSAEEGGDDPVAEGIRRALQRDDLTDEDRREFEAALKRLQEGKAPE